MSTPRQSEVPWSRVQLKSIDMDPKLSLAVWLLNLSIGIASYFGKIAFGHGLGDILYVVAILLLSLVFIPLVILKRSASNFSFVVGCIFFVYLLLNSTVFRGSEYPWNGHVFY